MPGGRFHRRLRRISAALRIPLLVGAIASLLATILAIVWWALEQLAGDAIARLLQPLTSQLLSSIPRLLPPLTAWAVQHPAEVSAILFFMIATIVILRAYAESRPLKGLSPILPFNPDRPYGNLVGAIIHNNTGEDLLNCRCHALAVTTITDRKWLDRGFRLPQELHWNTELKDFVRERVEIPSGTSARVILAALDGQNRAARIKVTEISDDYFEIPHGRHEAEIVFGGNHRDGTTVTQTFWIELEFRPPASLSVHRIHV